MLERAMMVIHGMTHLTVGLERIRESGWMMHRVSATGTGKRRTSHARSVETSGLDICARNGIKLIGEGSLSGRGDGLNGATDGGSGIMCTHRGEAIGLGG